MSKKVIIMKVETALDSRVTVEVDANTVEVVLGIDCGISGFEETVEWSASPTRDNIAKALQYVASMITTLSNNPDEIDLMPTTSAYSKGE